MWWNSNINKEIWRKKFRSRDQKIKRLLYFLFYKWYKNNATKIENIGTWTRSRFNELSQLIKAEMYKKMFSEESLRLWRNKFYKDINSSTRISEQEKPQIFLHIFNHTFIETLCVCVLSFLRYNMLINNSLCVKDEVTIFVFKFGFAFAVGFIRFDYCLQQLSDIV